MTARILPAALAGLVLLAAPADARTVTDSAGRTVAIPDTVTRVFASGPPASIAIYALRPEVLLGWPRALRDYEKPYIAAPYRDLPETGRLTGRGGEARHVNVDFPAWVVEALDRQARIHGVPR